MQRDEIINSLIKKNNYKSYLEIGIGDGENFKKIECDYKTNVDPFFDTLSGQGTLLPINRITSDEYFANTTEMFDIIFIDGLHTFEQTLKDINNSLKHLNSKGVIIGHDMLPPTEWHQRDISDFEGGQWTGTCWKAVAFLRTNNPDLTITTVDTDWGVSLIREEIAELFDKQFEEIDYNFFAQNKTELMNIITVEDFKNIFLC
jgi:hypothetical protein